MEAVEQCVHVYTWFDVAKWLIIAIVVIVIFGEPGEWFKR